jgi:hypothetical protein
MDSIARQLNSLGLYRPRDAQITLALIKLTAPDPRKRIRTLFINFGGPGQSGVDRAALEKHRTPALRDTPR